MNSGTAPKPCPTVYNPLPDGHVKVKILNPASTLANTLESIEPLVLDDALPPAFQFHATVVSLDSLKVPVILKPSLSKVAKVLVVSAPVVLVLNAFVEPRIVSSAIPLPV